MTLRYNRPGQVCVEHRLDVPLDHDDPDGPRIELFAREVVAQHNADVTDLPWLLFLQGRPGNAADRPSSSSAWLHQALRDYRVLLLDQRGTGLCDDLPLVGPQGLAEVMIAGGLPSLTAHPDQVYRAAHPRALAHSERFYARYPGDRKVARQVVDHLADNDVRLPSGERLSAERFRMDLIQASRQGERPSRSPAAEGRRTSIGRLSHGLKSSDRHTRPDTRIPLVLPYPASYGSADHSSQPGTTRALSTCPDLRIT